MSCMFSNFFILKSHIKQSFSNLKLEAASQREAVLGAGPRGPPPLASDQPRQAFNPQPRAMTRKSVS